MAIDVNGLEQLIKTVAHEELMPRFTRVKRTEKSDGSVVTEADLVVQQRLQSELNRQYPDIGFLGEEMPAEQQEALLAAGQPIWLLDPLDGTSNFAGGIPHFGISLALLADTQVQLGIVYDPNRDECFSAIAGEGARLNNDKIIKKPLDIQLKQTSALIDFKRLPTELSVRLVRDKPYASQRSFGSVALDWCWMATGRCHVYLHGQSNIWDYAAGHLVFQEVGGCSIGLDGAALFMNSLTPRAAVGALHKPLFDDWVNYLNECDC